MAGSRARAKAQSAAQKTRTLLGRSAADAVSVLVTLMRDEGQKPELRMKAAESILDRACGTALITQSGTASEPPTSIVFEGVLEEWSR